MPTPAAEAQTPGVINANTPMKNLVEEELQIQERPVITLSEPNNNPEPQPRQLRNRQALRPPDIFQAGFD